MQSTTVFASARHAALFGTSSFPRPSQTTCPPVKQSRNAANALAHAGESTWRLAQAFPQLPEHMENAEQNALHSFATVVIGVLAGPPPGVEFGCSELVGGCCAFPGGCSEFPSGTSPLSSASCGFDGGSWAACVSGTETRGVPLSPEHAASRQTTAAMSEVCAAVALSGPPKRLLPAIVTNLSEVIESSDVAREDVPRVVLHGRRERHR